MGTFYTTCRVENHGDPKKGAVITKLLVDTGSEFTWLPGNVLERVGIVPVKKDLSILMANGEIVTRSVGFAVLRVDKFFTIDEAVFARCGDVPRLGCRALSGMNARMDRQLGKLTDAGPVIAAAGESMSFEPPSPRPSPPGEGEASARCGCSDGIRHIAAFKNFSRENIRATRQARCARSLAMIPPLLGGEGRGEGERFDQLHFARLHTAHRHAAKRIFPSARAAGFD